MPTLTEGWQLGEPDFIITLPTIEIPAEGKDIFPTPNLTIDIPEDRWIRALEIRPIRLAMRPAYGEPQARSWRASPSSVECPE